MVTKASQIKLAKHNMPIKLLSKQEINQRQANQKRVEVDQGRKLANRVDTLRELAAQEEVSLASFRAKTLKAINAETEQAAKERGEMLAQVKTLREEIQIGLKPIEKAEIALKAKLNDIKEREDQIKQRTKLIKVKEDDIKNDFQKINAIQLRLTYIQNRLEEMYLDAEDQLNRAEIIFENAELKKRELDLWEKNLREELFAKDINVASRERDITIKEERVQKQHEALNERELQLIDREQTLEREFKRLKL